MATEAQAVDAPRFASLRDRLAESRPSLVYWVLGLIVYGAAAANFASGHYLDQTSRDLWQHLAALRTLIADPFDPSNPFIVSEEGSRHFHPYWLAVALVARFFSWDEWQAIGVAGFASAAILLWGIWTFGRAFYRDARGPIALLAAMTLGWSLPISHTGYHSIQTLLEGMAYPAGLMIGLSLVLWALIIRTLETPVRMVPITLLTAFMFATHQLGAGIAFITAGWFILLWPTSSRKSRAKVVAAMAAGLVLAAAWPYHDPFSAIARTGNATWTGGLPFYSPLWLMAAGVPSLIGLWGLCRTPYARASTAVVASFASFAAIFAIGPFGVPIATRFAMPAVLMLHIGLGALFIALADRWPSLSKRLRLSLFGIAAASVQFQAVATYANLAAEGARHESFGSAYVWADALTADLADDEPVAAYDVAAWPIVATGQRVASVPWPEPMIGDLLERQAAVERLFDPALSRSERLNLAREWKVKVLVLDSRGPIRRSMPEGLVERLESQSVRWTKAGPLIRFDLE